LSSFAAPLAIYPIIRKNARLVTPQNSEISG
jgi:hypothetical protein